MKLLAKTTVALYIFCISFMYANSQILFEDNASDLGINVTGNFSTVLGGVSFFDFDNDGWDDITFASKSSYLLKFFKNVSGTFVEQSFNIISIGHSKQVLWVDYDNDGDNDLFVSKVDQANKLYQNDGSFNFTDVSIAAGLSLFSMKTYGASFGDYDNDGDLDLFLCNKDNAFVIPNQLYRNNGDGTFTDVSIAAGISPVGHLSFCSAFFDFNNDGFQDIYISNDRFANKNILYKNNGDGTFTDVSLTSGADVAANAMSTTIADYNNDGWLDIYITNTVEGNHLLKNNGDETFTDVATSTGTIFNSIGWGANFFDADNDMDLDLYVSSMVNDTSSGLLTNAFYECLDTDNYIIPTTAGFDNDNYVSFSNAIGDINNDGFQDFVVVNQAPDNHSLWQNTGGTNNWLKVKLEGVTSNRQGIGTWIEISVNGDKMYRYTLCGEAFLGQNSSTEIFGIGSNAMIDYVKVTWLSGEVDMLYNVTPNQTLNIVEGSTLTTDEFISNGFDVYPNPSKSTMFIKSQLTNDYTLSLFNILGKKIITNQFSGELNSLDVDALNSGVYFLQINSTGNILTKKIIIK